MIHDTTEKIPLERQEGGKTNARRRCVWRKGRVSLLLCKTRTSDNLSNNRKVFCQIIIE